MQGRPVRTDPREGGSLDHACGTDSPDGRMPTAGDCGIRVGYSTVTQTPEFKRALKRSNGRFTLGLLLGCVGLPILVGIIM